LTFDTGDIF